MMVKIITSKYKTDFEYRVSRFLNSVLESYGSINSVHYSAGWNGSDCIYTAMIIYKEEDENE